MSNFLHFTTEKIVKTSSTSENNCQIAPRPNEVVVIKSESNRSIGAQTIKLEEAVDEINMGLQPGKIDSEKNRYPYCIVWTPIPFLT